MTVYKNVDMCDLKSIVNYPRPYLPLGERPGLAEGKITFVIRNDVSLVDYFRPVLYVSGSGC